MDHLTGDANNTSVRVEIFDQAFNLRSNHPDCDYILQLAEYVDSKMRAVAEHPRTVDSTRLAVLRALGIDDECHLLKTKLDDEESRKRSLKPFTEETDSPPGRGASDTTPSAGTSKSS